VRKQVPGLVTLFFLLIFCGSALAQPNISYTPSSNTLTVGTAASLTAGNNGSAVAGIGYASSSDFATVNDPYAVATDASGNVFTIDGTHGYLYKYNSAGVGGTINTSVLNSPAGIVVDGLGNVYVSDFGSFNDYVYKFSSSGTLLATITGFSSPYGLAVDASNNVYVANSGNNTIKKIAAGATTATTYITLSTAPYGLAIDPAGNMFISENNANAIVKVAAGGTTVSAFYSTGLNGPRHITTDNAGNVYVSDYNNDAIKRIIPAGTSATTLLSSLSNPRGVAVDPAGNLYYGNYSSTNKIRKSVPTGGWFINDNLPAGLSFNSSTGAISGTPTTVTQATTYTVYAYNSSGSSQTNVTITVRPATPTISGGGTGCTLTLTASGGSPSGGTYTWYNTSSGGSALATGTTYAATAGTYYVSYTYNTVESARSSGTTVIAGGLAIASAPTGNGLYFSYPFSGNANDASSAGNNGTVVSSAPLTADRYGAANSAYSFNGSSQYIYANTQIASPGPSNFSISAWFKTSTGGGLIVGYGSSKTTLSSNYDRNIYMTAGGQLYYGLYTGVNNTLNTTTSYADGNWHHVVATTSSTDGSYLYVDGAVVAGDPTMTSAQSFAGYWRIGNDKINGWPNATTNTFFTGSIDDVAVYKSAIDATTVYTLYGAGSAPTCVGSPLYLVANSVSGATYSWTGPNGFTSNQQNPTVTNTATAANAGTYTVTVTSASGCSTTLTVTAVVNAVPTATFTATSPVNIGATSTITYSGTYVSTSTYTWDFNGGTVVSGSGVGPYTVKWTTAGNKTVTLTVANAAGCTASSTQTVTVSAPNYGDYSFKKTITLNTTTLGITSNLSNFPALLSITDPNLIISSTCTDKVYTPNGPNYDFAFYDSGTSNELYYQVESYNQTTGTLLVWVQIPSLTYATNNSITFFYGSKSPVVTHNTAFFQNTWGSDYKAVYHFNEGTYSGSVTDGTSGGHTGTTGGMSSADLVTGKIGTAYSFNGSSKSITSNAVNITGAFTISAWAYATTVGVDQKILTNQGSDGSSTGGYKLGIYSNNIPETESASAGTRWNGSQPTAISANTWHYIQGVFTGTQLSTYIDGVQYEVTSTTVAPWATLPLYIGVGEGGNKYYFNGIIDEARISNVAKSGDWLKAEYVNQNNPVAFTSGGTTTVVTANAALVPGALTYTWKGVSTDPTSASNWDNTTAGTTNELPSFTTGTVTLVIPAGLSNYPSLTGNMSLYGLTIASGAKVNLNSWTLNVGCNIYNSSAGQVLYGTSTSTINWNGSQANQVYVASSAGNTASLGNMTLNNSSGGTLTLTGGPVDLYNTLTITKGNLVINNAGNGDLTLKSSSTLTASVAAIPAGYSITGLVNVERYISGGQVKYRGYRFLSSPVYTANVGTDYFFDFSYLKTYAPVTSTGGTGDGSDKSGNPTIYLYRDDKTFTNASFNGGNFRGVNKINNSPAYNVGVDFDGNFKMRVGMGFWFFYRGDRSNISTKYTSTTVAEANTFITRGTLNQQTVTYYNWFTGLNTLQCSGSTSYTGFNLVGNPYASSIDWDKHSATDANAGIYTPNVGNTIYILNETTKVYGLYTSGSGGIGINGATNIIPSGQGFYVKATSASAQVIFHESAKTSAQVTGPTAASGSTLLLSTKPVEKAPPPQYLRLEMRKDSNNVEESVVLFEDNAHNEFVNGEDAEHFSGSGNVGFASMSSDNLDMAINHIPFPKLQQTIINLDVYAGTDGQYALNRTEIKNIPDIYEIWLKDAYKKDSLDFKANSTYLFDVIKSDPNSMGQHRFSLVIRQNKALGLHLLDFAATKQTTGAQMVWKTENERNTTYFTIERSTDNGKTFNVVGGVSSGSEGTYSLTDKNPTTGTDYYRLKLEDLNGTITYSDALPLVYTTGNNQLAGAAVSVYPNPAKSTLNVSIVPSIKQIVQPVKTTFNITITGSNGTVIKKATSTQTEWQDNVTGLLPGSYVLQVVDNADKKVVGQAKFVKL